MPLTPIRNHKSGRPLDTSCRISAHRYATPMPSSSKSGRGAAQPQVTAQAQPFARGAPRGARPPMARARSQRIRVQPHEHPLGRPSRSTIIIHQQDSNKIDGELLPAGCADGLRDDLARLFGACGCVSVREGPETNVPVRTKLRREMI